MKRILAVLVTVSLVVCLFASTALASSKDQVLGLKNYLQENFGNQLVVKDYDGTIDDFFTLHYFMDEEDANWIGIHANGDGFDNAIKEIVSGSDDNSWNIIQIFLNAGGTIAKLVKQYGITDTAVFFLYETDEDVTGSALTYCIAVIGDSVIVTTDDIFNLATSFSIQKNYTADYFFDVTTLDD